MNLNVLSLSANTTWHLPSVWVRSDGGSRTGVLLAAPGYLVTQHRDVFAPHDPALQKSRIPEFHTAAANQDVPFGTTWRRREARVCWGTKRGRW